MIKNIELKLGGGEFVITVDADAPGGGAISSNLHYETLEEYQEADEDTATAEMHARYEGAIDGVESLILALVCNGVDIEQEPFPTAIQGALDAIGHNL